MKKKNYLSGLLAGVLTAGILQGSDGNEKMPGLGGKKTPVVQGVGNPILKQMALFLAENSYRNGDVASAEIILNSVGLDGATIINAWATQPQLRIVDFGGEEIEDISPIPEMKEEKPIAQKIAEENTAKAAQLDPYSMLQVAQYMDTESIKEVQKVNSKFAKEPSTGEIQGHGKLFNQLKMNPSPITNENKHLFSKIETQQIFGSNDHILPGMYQYIITYPVTKEEIEDWVVRLRGMHNKKSQTPIVFEYQLLPDLWDKTADQLINEIITETEDFKIKQYYTNSNTSAWHFEASYYRRLQWFNCFKKPIVFKTVGRICVENGFDLFVEKGSHTGFNPKKHIIKEYEIGQWERDIKTTYSKYHDFIQKYPVIQYPEVAKVSFFNVYIDGKEINEQQRQFKILSEDKKVQRISIEYKQELNKSPELLGNTKVVSIYGDYVVYLQSFGKSRLVMFCCAGPFKTPVGIKLYNFYGFQCKNDVVSEAVKKYVQYVNDNNLAYLSGFVNFANKPSYLTDEEWRKVIVLTGMVEKIMDLVDQKFNEYEANPYAAPAADPYGCDGYGCVGYNPYRQYYYGYGC